MSNVSIYLEHARRAIRTHGYVKARQITIAARNNSLPGSRLGHGYRLKTGSFRGLIILAVTATRC